MADLAGWERSGLPDGFRLSVNLPPRFISRTAKVDRIMALLASSPSHRVVAEISERSVLDDLELADDRLSELRGLGVQVTIDDFGIGTASLTLLRRMQLDRVKIDRSFITGLADGLRDQALVAGFVRLSTELGLSITAEGVETEQQAATLLRFGCHLHQGYLYGEAVPAIQFAELLRSATTAVVRPVTTLAS